MKKIELSVEAELNLTADEVELPGVRAALTLLSDLYLASFGGNPKQYEDSIVWTGLKLQAQKAFNAEDIVRASARISSGNGVATVQMQFFGGFGRPLGKLTATIGLRTGGLLFGSANVAA